ncbi:MAG: hypothetical protein ABIG64_08390 [Candidatus Omnitrophota bacterium]
MWDFKKINKEYLLLFVLVIFAGFLIYSSTLKSQIAPEEILFPTYYSSPSGVFDHLMSREYRDLNYCDTINQGAGPIPQFYQIDPSGVTVLEDLWVDDGATLGDIVMDGRLSWDNQWTTIGYYINLNSTVVGDQLAAYVGHLKTRFRITMGANTPGADDTPPTIGPDGKPIKGEHVWDISEGIHARDCQPGDVVKISQGQKWTLVKTEKSFDSHVAGIISQDPKLFLGDEQGKMPLALAGIVKCKVTNENGPIKIGDLLVSASLAGYAMQAAPDEIKPGMLVGKALQALDSEKGEILVLVNKK